MKSALPALFGLGGLALIIGLVVHAGAGDVLALLQTAGWGLLWLVPFHLLPLLLDAEGWRALLRASDPARIATRPFLLWIAAVREAVGRLLPVASVGGEIVGIRLVLLRPLSGAAVSASVVIEILLTIVNQYLFTALGLVLLLVGADDPNLVLKLLLGLAATLPAPIALYALLRYGGFFARVEAFLIGMLGEEHRAAALFGSAGKLDAEIRALFGRRRDLLLGLLWQLAGMLVGAFEVWLALRLLGHPVSPAAAIGLESLTLAIRHFAFFVPGGLGVQEAGLIVVGQMIGIDSETALSLSLAKRMREILFGVPALISWQAVEGQRLRRALKARVS
jgi:putative membrane protein